MLLSIDFSGWQAKEAEATNRRIDSVVLRLSSGLARVGLYRRTSRTTAVPYARRDVWKITVQMTSYDPGGANACPAGATAGTCPALRVYHHIIFLVDDKAAKVLEATPY